MSSFLWDWLSLAWDWGEGRLWRHFKGNSVMCKMFLERLENCENFPDSLPFGSLLQVKEVQATCSTHFKQLLKAKRLKTQRCISSTTSCFVVREIAKNAVIWRIYVHKCGCRAACQPVLAEIGKFRDALGS